MATALELRVWSRPADPASIDHELAALWAEIGREQPVARAMMSNLVIVLERPSTDHLDLTRPVESLPLDDIARRHPARIVLVYRVRSGPINCPPVAAAVSVRTVGVGAAKFGIETIAVDSRCAESSLPSIIRRLIVGDVPTALWWADDLSQGGPHPSLVSMSRQLLYDSRTWRDPRAGFAAAAPMFQHEAAPGIGDLNWRRLAPLRLALASIVRHRDDMLDTAFRAQVICRPGERALADLLAGWIAARLRWSPDVWAVTIEERRHGDEVLHLTLTDGLGDTVTASQDGHRVLVRDVRTAAPIVLPVPRETIADSIALELASLTQDVCLRDAVLALAQRRP